MADPFGGQSGSYHHAPLRTIPGLDMDLSRTEDINYLRCRNIQLETELRFVKEQLVLAHSGTQYIINCLTSATARNHQSSSGQQQPRLEHKQETFDHLTAPPKITQGSIGKVADTVECDTLKCSNFSPDHYGSMGDPSKALIAHTSRTDDLLTFDDHQPSPAGCGAPSPRYVLPYEDPSTLRSSFTSSAAPYTPYQTPHVKNRKLEDVGLGIQDVDSDHYGEHDPPLEFHREPEHDSGRRRAHPTQYSPTSPGPVSGSLGLWSPIHAPPTSEPELVFNRAFLNAEHNRLMSAACFIEEMTGEEREQHWTRLEQEKGRHSAQEWKLYYERVILPAYLSKAKRVDSAVLAPSTVEQGDRSLAQEERDIEAHAGMRPANEDDTSIFLPRNDDSEDGKSPNSHQASILNAGSEIETVAMDALTRDLPGKIEGNEQAAPRQGKDTMNDNGLTHGQSITTLTTTRKHLGEAAKTSTPSPDFDERKTASCGPQKDSHFVDGDAPSRPQGTPRLGRRPPFQKFPMNISEILYRPDANDSFELRTILISNIMAGVTLAEVISNICGGRVVKAIFVETKGMKTTPPMTTNSAMVEFLDANDAAFVVETWTRMPFNPLASTISLRLLEATVLSTPTRPLPPKLDFDMRERGLTRVLYIVFEEQELTPDTAMEEIRRRSPNQKRPLVAGELQDGSFFYEFADVRDAAMAWEIVDMNRGYFRGIKKGFLPDPCSRRIDVEDGQMECSSGSNADDEGDGGSTVVNTPAASLQVNGHISMEGDDQ